MEKIKKTLHTLFFPKVFVIVSCVLAAAALLIYTFGFYGEEGIVAYVSYVFSAYALVIFCLRFSAGVRQAKGCVSGIASQNRYVRRYMTDASFKTKISLSVSVGLNAGYAILKFVTGVFYGSAWLITLAAYYTLLLMMRFLLLHYINRNSYDMTAEWKRCRTCGIVLIFMNIILIGMVVLVLRRGEGIVYAGYLIYVMALYDFYTMAMAIVNLIKSRKQKSPVLTATKAINMAAALITMLSLETAMITQFGAEDGETFRHTMVASTGGGICVIMVIMAIFMIAKSTKSLKEIRFNNFRS